MAMPPLPERIRTLTPGGDGWPRGELVHTLPGSLTNVLVVQCRGEGYDARGVRRPLPPRVWRVRDDAGRDRWAPGAALVLDGPPAEWNDLVVTGLPFGAERDPKTEGYLGELRAQESVPRTLTPGGDASVLARRMNLLAFYDALPPPNFRKLDYPRDPALTREALGPGTDLTPLLTGRRLIVLGQLEDGPLPAPLTLDGETVGGTGWTSVRLIFDY